MLEILAPGKVPVHRKFSRLKHLKKIPRRRKEVRSMATTVVRVIGKILSGRKTVCIQLSNGRVLVVSKPIKR